ncbi:MAG: hypothetical protein J6L74_02150, partial [Pseudomonas sp.]|nr:hypothetical protein [Pseudomonas sp.]
HIWVTVEDGAEACRAVGVEVVPADVFAVKSITGQEVRISLTAAASVQALKVALERIAGLQPSAGGRGNRPQPANKL